jgi:hypothetical protein
VRAVPGRCSYFPTRMVSPLEYQRPSRTFLAPWVVSQVSAAAWVVAVWIVVPCWRILIWLVTVGSLARWCSALEF